MTNNHNKSKKSIALNRSYTRKDFFQAAAVFALVFSIASAFFYFTGYFNHEPIRHTTDEKAQTVNLSFFSRGSSNCSLDGDLYVDNVKYGQITGGAIKVDGLQDNSVVKIKGVTGDCFGKDSGFAYESSWKINGVDYYKETGKNVPFYTNLAVRNPSNLEEMQSFIRAEDVDYYLPRVTRETRSEADNMDAIAKYGMSYITDMHHFGQEEYWQTPLETLNNKNGDCEDWAVTVLSLMKAYRPEKECYNVIWSTHVSVLCYIDGDFIMYDQGKTKTIFKAMPNPSNDSLINQENRREARKFLNSYFDSYGLRPDERKLIGIYDDKDVKYFNSLEEFIDWMILRNV